MKKLAVILLVSIISCQDVLDDEICLPREQVQALLSDAEQLPIAENKLAIKDSIISSNNEALAWQDSTIVLLEEQLALQDSLFEDLQKENTAYEAWYIKYVYALVGFLTGIGAENIAN